MGNLLILAAYAIYAAFWIRFFMHTLVWWRAVRRLESAAAKAPRPGIKVWVFSVLDVLFLGRLLRVNPALWFGEWVFHATFLLVLARHLRFFLNPVPKWVWQAQTPGMIAGYILPFSLVYILVVRLVSKQEKYTSRANAFLLGLVLAISSIGVLMRAVFKPDLVGVKLFIFGIMSLSPVPPPDSMWFTAHFILVLVLVPLLPTHIFTAPLVMLEARKREQALHGVMHEPEEHLDADKIR